MNRDEWIERHKKGRLCAYKFIRSFYIDQPDITIEELTEIIDELIEELKLELEK